jgi:putative FmdB family regulatory protein
MPIYEYICSDCKCRFEQLRPVSRADEDAACPKCKRAGKRVPSRFASFAKTAEGVSAPIAGAGGGCSSCGASSCSTCH